MRKMISKGFFKNFVFAGGFVAVAVVPKVALADNITDAMIGAYQTSGLLEQNRALLRATDENVAIAVAQLRPVITWTLTASQSFSRANTGFGVSQASSDALSTGLNLQWLLFDGGASLLDQRAAQETVLATRQSLLNIEQQVMFNAVQAYVNVLLQQDTVSLRGNNLRLLREEQKAAQDRFEVGEVTRTDVALAQSRVAAAQASLTESRGDLLTAQAVYIEVVGHAPGGLAGQPSLPQRVKSLQTAQSIAARNHPSLLAQQHAVKAADLSAQSTAKSLGPSVSFSASAAYSEPWDNTGGTDTSSTSLTLSQPIYAGGALAARTRASVARVDAEKGALISVQRSVAQIVSQAYVVLETSRASLVSSNERVRAAQVAFDGIREEATLGARTTLDVLQSEQELLDAQTSRVQARANQVIAAFGLLSAQGLLTAEHLGLAVEIYDPTLYYNLVKDAPAHVSQRSKDLDRVMKALGKN